MKLFVTGGAGFIGSHFIRLILNERPDWSIVNLDNLSYAGNLATMKDLESHHHQFVRGDICDTALVEKLLKDHHIDIILNFAAESHVDRSIQSAEPFIRTNILGTESLLAAARRHGIQKYIQISTDEVYGSAQEGESFSEHSTLCPNNPYSASKAAADHMVRAYHVTHKLPTCVTRCTNNYGSFQYPEKFLPVVISKALANEKIPVYGDGLQKREWLHVSDHCRGILAVLEHGKVGEVYNISDDIDITNIEVAQQILSILNKPASLIQHVTDRPGHDRCYRVNSLKIRHELDWAPRITFDAGLRDTIQWYQQNADWTRTVLSHS